MIKYFYIFLITWCSLLLLLLLLEFRPSVMSTFAQTEKYRKVMSEIEAGAALTKVDLTDCNLDHFPIALFKLFDSLEFLNLSNNNLHDLPAEFIGFQKLRILFFANNKFISVPQVCERI